MMGLEAVFQPAPSQVSKLLKMLVWFDIYLPICIIFV